MYKFLLSILISVFIIPATYATPAKPKKWTFIIFLNGNNNLDRFGYHNLKQMEKIGSTDDINIIVQWASISQGKVVRLKIEKSTDSKHVTSPVIENLGKVDMGDYKSLEDFVVWSMKYYPAEHYFVDVWNHGSGWSLKPSLTNRDISEDELTGHVITTEQLGAVMDHASKSLGRNIDIYGSDACLMGMVEVAKQLSSSTNYFVGSETLEPGDGWPYDTFLTHWAAKPDMTPQEVTSTLGKDFVEYYKQQNDGWGGVTLASYDLTKIATVESAISDLGKALRTLNKSDVVKFSQAAHDVQRFESPISSDYGDLIDLMNRLKTKNINVDPKLIDAVIAASQAFVISNFTIDFSHAYGVAIWLPVSYEDAVGNDRANRYRKLPFDMDTEWADTMTYLLHNT